MQSQKIAIRVPKDIVGHLDVISREKGLSRSRLVSDLLRESLAVERAKALQDTYNRVFADRQLRDEQLETSRWFEEAATTKGQEW